MSNTQKTILTAFFAGVVALFVLAAHVLSKHDTYRELITTAGMSEVLGALALVMFVIGCALGLNLPAVIASAFKGWASMKGDIT